MQTGPILFADVDTVPPSQNQGVADSAKAEKSGSGLSTTYIIIIAVLACVGLSSVATMVVVWRRRKGPQIDTLSRMFPGTGERILTAPWFGYTR